MSPSSSLAFATPLPFRLSPNVIHHTAFLPRRPATPCRRTAPSPVLSPPRAQNASHSPDYSAGFSPEADPDYEEVRVLSFAPSRHDSCLLTLQPVHGGKYAFKMSITTSQADSIRAAFAHDACCNRPTTHDLFNRVLRLSGAIVIKAAITHISDDVFIARLWLRVQGEELSVDSRPSDAIALALRSKAPLFLNTNLLKQWHIDVDIIERDARHGLCERVCYDEQLKTSRSLRDELRHKPEHIRLAILKMRLDLAVRTQRFGEAAHLKHMIDEICPIDRLTEQLKKAVMEQRFLDAAGIQDRITIWRARLRMWEKGAVDLDDWQQNGEQ